MLDSQQRLLDANTSDVNTASMTQSIRPFFDRLSRTALLVGALLLSAILAAPSSVAQEVPVSTEDVVNSDLQAGDTFTVPVTVENLDQADDVLSYDITLDYGSAPVSFNGFETAGTLTEEADLTTDQNDDTGAEQASISAFGSDPLGTAGNSGVLVNATFTVESQGSGPITFPDIKFNDVNAPDADLSRADFSVIFSENVLRIEDGTAGIGETSTLDVSATDLSGLDVTNLDIEIEVSDPVELDGQNPVTFVTSELDQTDASYDASTDVLSITGFSSGDALTGDEVLFELNTQAVGSEADVPVSFDGANTELRDSNGNVVSGVALDDGSLRIVANDAPTISQISDQTIDEDSQTDPLQFTVGDQNTDPSNLAVSGESDNADLVPNDSINIEGSGADRTVTVTPSADSNGTADITITAEDPDGASAEETFTLVVESVPDAPVAVNDTFTVDQGGELLRSAPGLLENDEDADGDDLEASTFAQEGPANGDVNISSDGAFRYTPNDGFAGTDEFVYQVSDGDLTDTGTVTINVEPVRVTISGTVSYPGEGESGLTDGRPLSDIPVEVSAVTGDTTIVDTTGSDGTFSVDVQAGEYDVGAQIDRDVPSSEINATDANRTIGAYLGTNPFAGDFQSEVADVNESGSANATDALKMALFFNDPAGTIFEAGDWATTAQTVDVTSGSDASVSVLAAAYGDADLSGADQGGSNAVATASSTSRSANSEEDLRSVKTDEAFNVPVRLSDGATLGSYSIEVGFPADKVSFEGVAGEGRDVMSASEDGTVRLSWFDKSGKQPLKLSSGASLVTLRFSPNDGVEKGTAFTPEIKAGELADPNAQPLAQARLGVESVQIGSNLPNEFALKGSYPNPVSGGQTTIEMDLPSRTTVTVEVYNTLGQQVQTIEQSMAGGAGQTIQVNGSQLASGQYFYRVEADLKDGTAQETGQITVVR
jgi:hypothetical protein